MSISETARTSVRRRTREDRQPDYTVRARKGRVWGQIGAAWKADRQGSNVVISGRINDIPVGFDGVFKIMVPLPPDDEPDDEPTGDNQP